MSGNLNERLYKRFGIAYPADKVVLGFRREVNVSIDHHLSSVIQPDKTSTPEVWWNIQSEVLTEVARNLFEKAYNGTTWQSGLGVFIDKHISDTSPADMSEYLLNLQVLLEAVSKQEKLKRALVGIVTNIKQYLDDFPLLNFTIKEYKTKPPQILPRGSKIFSDSVSNTLELLDTDGKYGEILEHYEAGLKELLSAKTKQNLKDVVEDIYTACDIATGLVLGEKEAGIRFLFQKKRAEGLGLNEWQIKIFDGLRGWMDKIKHGSIKDYSREDIEQIILLASTLIRTLVIRVK